MTTTILNVTFDCTDAGRVARFWAEASGWPLRQQDPSPGHEEYSVGPPADGRQSGPRLYFVTVPEPRIVKNRIHLDLLPAGGSQQDEIARLVELGATVAESQVPGAGWVVMADPEGNEFCLEPGD
jgi:predicted enzyme related to lactoylglutathione lyase